MAAVSRVDSPLLGYGVDIESWTSDEDLCSGPKEHTWFDTPLVLGTKGNSSIHSVFSVGGGLEDIEAAVLCDDIARYTTSRVTVNSLMCSITLYMCPNAATQVVLKAVPPTVDTSSPRCILKWAMSMVQSSWLVVRNYVHGHFPCWSATPGDVPCTTQDLDPDTYLLGARTIVEYVGFQCLVFLLAPCAEALQRACDAKQLRVSVSNGMLVTRPAIPRNLGVEEMPNLKACFPLEVALSKQTGNGRLLERLASRVHEAVVDWTIPTMAMVSEEDWSSSLLDTSDPHSTFSTKHLLRDIVPFVANNRSGTMDRFSGYASSLALLLENESHGMELLRMAAPTCFAGRDVDGFLMGVEHALREKRHQRELHAVPVLPKEEETVRTHYRVVGNKTYMRDALESSGQKKSRRTMDVPVSSKLSGRDQDVDLCACPPATSVLPGRVGALV